MDSVKPKSLNYYFLRDYIYPKKPKGFRENIVLFVSFRNKGDSHGKYLMIQEKNSFWNLPKKGLTSEDVFDGIVDSVVRDIGEEMGFRGIVNKDLRPRFIQRAYLFNFAIQRYDEIRSEDERKKGRPDKGKIYHLAVIDYLGPEDLPFDKKRSDIHPKDFRWVDFNEGEALVLSNRSPEINSSKVSVEFNISLHRRIFNASKYLEKIYKDVDLNQISMF